jgi:hypothetical protein
MLENELRAVIREVLVELLGPQRRRALVMFTGGLLGFEDAVDELRALGAAGVELDYIQTPSAQRILDQDLIASLGMREVQNKYVEEHHMLIAPTLTSNIAAKVAHGIADCRASNLFSEFIMTNKPVVASRTAICPDGDAKQGWFPAMPEGYAAMLRGNLSALASFGVRLAEARTLCRTALAAWERAEEQRRAPLIAALGDSPAAVLQQLGAPASPVETRAATVAAPATTSARTVVPCRQKLISQQIIARVPDGAELRIAPAAKITALAHELAAQRAISITREV